MNRLSAFCLAICLPLVAADKHIEKALRQIPPVAQPVEVLRASDSRLAAFGVMYSVYRAAFDDGPIVFEIDRMASDASNDKLPSDISQFVRNALARTGILRSYMLYPEGASSTGMLAPMLPYMWQSLEARAKPPTPTFRLVGKLQRATETLNKGNDGRTDGEFGGGKTLSSIQLSRDKSAIITALTLTLMAERIDRIDEPNAISVQRVLVVQSERNGSLSIYIGANGIGFGSKMKISQDSFDSLTDAVGAGLLKVLGICLRVPHWRLSGYANRDSALEQRMYEMFVRLTPGQLEQQIKRFMIIAGFGIDVKSVEMTPDDRGSMITEMQHRRLNARDRFDQVTFLQQLWRDLDYVHAAPMVRKMIAENDFFAAVAKENEVKEEAALTVDPGEFGWAPGATMVVLDLSRLPEGKERELVFAAIRQTRGYVDLREHKQKPIAGVRIYSTKDEVLFALRHLKLEPVWMKTSQASPPRLLLVQLKSTVPAVRPAARP